MDYINQSKINFDIVLPDGETIAGSETSNIVSTDIITYLFTKVIPPKPRPIYIIKCCCCNNCCCNNHNNCNFCDLCNTLRCCSPCKRRKFNNCNHYYCKRFNQFIYYNFYKKILKLNKIYRCRNKNYGRYKINKNYRNF